MRLFVLLLLLCPAVASAWSEADTKRQVAYTTLHIIDWGQTLDISNRCEPDTRTTENDYKTLPGGSNQTTTETDPPEVNELNPHLGSCPSRSEVNRYFLVTGLGHYAVSRMLPSPYRKWWQRVTIAVEGATVAHNISVGVRIRY